MGFEQYYFERLGIFKYIYQFIGGHISFKETLYFYGDEKHYILCYFNLIYCFFMPNSIEILNFLKKKFKKIF